MASRLARRHRIACACASAMAAIVMPGLVSGAFDRAAAQSEPQMSAGILAVQVRKQGFACSNPQRIARDAARSTPAHAMWVLTCQNATYMVHLVPKMSARVERVE